MADPNSPIVGLADAVSDVLYGVAGWLLVCFGAVMALVSPTIAASRPGLRTVLATIAVLGLAVLFVLFGVMVNPRFGGGLEERRSVTEFGRVRTVDHRTIRSEEDRTAFCVSCESRMTRGVARRFREQFVVAGVPVRTLSEGRNYYCLDCATREYDRSDPATATRPPSDRRDGEARGRDVVVDRDYR